MHRLEQKSRFSARRRCTVSTVLHSQVVKRHSQVVKRRQVYFCEIRPAKTHSVPTSLGGAAMFCALFFGGHRTWPGSHCRSEIPQILWDLTAAARSPPPGFLGNCRGATVPTPAGGLPRSISVATEIDFGGSLFAPAPNSPPLFLRLFTLIMVPAAGTTMSVKTYARRLYSLGFSHSLCPRQPGPQ